MSGDGGESVAGGGVGAADVDLEGVAVARSAAKSAAVHEDAFGLPDGERGELIGEGFGIAGQFERFEGEDGRGGMVAVGVAGLGGESGDDHVGAEGADDADDIREHLLVAPFVEGALEVFRVAKVDGAGEELLRAIETAGGEKFLCADNPQLRPELRPQQILSAIAARNRQIGRA